MINHKGLGKSRQFCRVLLLSTALSLSFSTYVAAAQTTAIDGDAAIVTYEKDFFVKYSPVTLLDMLQRVPGMPEILKKNRHRGGGGANSRAERGFGSGGDQILIDGKRLAGKTNNINDTLGRISAGLVERIELIRGVASGLDVQSRGLVINIILSESSSNSTTFWRMKSETKQGHEPGFEALVSHSGSAGNFDYTVSAERNTNNGFFDRAEQFFDPDDTKTGDKDISVASKRRGFKFNTNLTYNFVDGAVLRLNGLFEPQSATKIENRIETGDDPESVLWNEDEEKDKWEFGGDYTRNLGALGKLKALFVINQDKESKIVDRFTGVGASEFQEGKDIEYEDKSEKISRASFTKTIFEIQTIEVGGEAAINTFDKIFNKTERDAVDNLFELDSSDNVEIQENRYEIFVNHTYNILPTLVLQSSLVTEFSKIVADNFFDDGTISRRDTSFTYFKPRINLRYDLTGQDQIRVTIEKKVSQLNFNNFVTRFDQRTEEIRLGNTNIRPEQLWEFSLAFEHRLANDGGSLEAEVFYRSYKDYITRVDFTEYEDFGGSSISREAFFALPPDMALRDMIDFTSKSDNVEKATAKGLRLKSNIRLGFIGIPQATFSANYTFEKRRGLDQFTLLERNFERASDHTLDLNFRHDITDLGLSYGARTSFRSDQETNNITYHWPSNPQPSINVFAEFTLFDGIKLRLDAKQLTGKRQTSTYNLYSDHIRFNELRQRSVKQSTVPREIEVSIQGTF